MNITFKIDVGRMSIRRIAILLFQRVYTDISACVIRPKNGQCEIQLFDSYASSEVLQRSCPPNAEVALISNHSSGNMTPSEDDLRNVKLIPGAKLFIVCERRCRYFKL